MMKTCLEAGGNSVWGGLTLPWSRGGHRRDGARRDAQGWAGGGAKPHFWAVCPNFAHFHPRPVFERRFTPSSCTAPGLEGVKKGQK